MEFLAGYDSDEESDDEQLQDFSKSKTTQLLPSPDDVLSHSAKSSIFKHASDSDFDQSQVLEKHVKMVENKHNITEVNGRKVCWMYRQGRCRAGKKCRFYHDSELRESDLRLQANASDPGVNNINPASRKYFKECSAGKSSEDEFERRFKKKRYGVSNNLEPPKKALKQIRDIQVKEKKFRK